MTEFTVFHATRGTPLVFRVPTTSRAATITALKTGSTSWQQFDQDVNTGTCINLATGAAIVSFNWKVVL